MDNSLNQLLASHPRLWRGSDRTRRLSGAGSLSGCLDTGYADLNQALHGGGWPKGVSSELYLPGQGIGEMRLLLPALRKLSGDGYICWVAPPYLPFAPMLARQGLDLSRLLIVPAESQQDRLWVAEQALLSGCCVAVFAWFGKQVLALRELRRLQLAAEQSTGWSVLFRQNRCLQLPSPSALRIALRPEPRGRLQLEIIKQPGGWGGQCLDLSVEPHYEQWQRLPVELLPTYTANPSPTITPAHHRGVDGGNATVTPAFPPSAG